MAVVYSLADRGKVLLMAQRCKPAMKLAIERDFGKHILLLTGKGSTVNSTVHARFVLPGLVVSCFFPWPC